MTLQKFTAAALAALTLALPLSGCRKGEKDGEEQAKPQVLTNVFRGTVYPLPEPYSVSENGLTVWDPATGRLTCAASGYTEGEDEDGNYTYTAKNAIFTLDENGVVEERELDGPGDDGYIQSVCLSGDDVVYLWSRWGEDGGDTWFLTRLDGETGERFDSGELTSFFTAADGGWFNVHRMCADGDGDIYLNADQEIVVLNRDFVKQFSVMAPGWINSMASSPEGEVIVAGYLNDAQSIAPIDKAAKALGRSTPLPDSVSDLYFGEGHDFYYTNDTGVWAADLGADGKYETTPILNFLNSNLSQDTATLLAVPDEETVLFAETTNEENWYRSPAVWHKAEDVDLSAVKVVEIAYATYMNSQLPGKIVKYNREHPDTRIIVTDFSQYATDSDWQAGQKKLATDMVNGLYKPDLVFGSPDNADIAALLSKKLYADLRPYTEKDDLFNPENLFGAVKSAFTAKDGSLWGLTSDFSISTLLSTPALLGKYASENGWTLGEMMDFAASLPEDRELMAYMTRDNGVSLLGGGYGAFIDEEAGTCDFENPDFVKYLEFVKSLPASWEEYQAKTASGQMDWDDVYRLYHEGKIALKDVNFYDLGEFLNLEMAFGTKDYTMIGFPKSGEGDTGSVFSTSNAYVMTKYAEDPETAWDVMKFLLDPSSAEHYDGIPPVKSAFEEMCGEYYTYKFEFYYDGSASWGSYDPETDEARSSEDLDRPGIVVFFTKDDAARIRDFLDQPVNPLEGAVNDEVQSIIREEISALSGGSVDAAGCAARIQSRVGLWLAEHK